MTLFPDSLEDGENVSSDDAGQADNDNPDDEDAVELGDDKLVDNNDLGGEDLELCSFIRDLSSGVTSLSLRLFSESLIILTTSA